MRSRGPLLVRGAGARCRAPARSARPASPPPLACRLEGLCSGSAACRSREPPNGPAPPWRRAEPGQPRGGHVQASWGGHTQNLCHAGHTAPGAAARPCPCAASSPGAPGARVLERCTAHLESPPPHNIALSLRASGHCDAQKPHVPFFNRPPVCLAIDFARMLSYQEVPTSIQVWQGQSQEAKIGRTSPHKPHTG